jgi:hypothetical protein
MADANPYVAEHVSPSGAYAVRTADNEARMSHWIRSAVLVDATGGVLFDFGDRWSADTIRWIDDTHVALDLRRYPGDRSAQLVVDATSHTAVVDGATLTFAELARWMR